MDSGTSVPAVGDTVEDLLWIASKSGVGVPPLAVLTLLVQLLKALRSLHQRGMVHGAVTPRALLLAGRRAEVLIEDPSRDPRLELLPRAPAAPSERAFTAPEVAAGERATAASDLYSAGAVARALLAGHSRLGALGLLIDALVRPQPETRWPLSKALSEARRLALELFEEWDRNRHAGRLRGALAESLERRDAAAIRDLACSLEDAAPGDPLCDEARKWLERRAGRETDLRHRLTRAIYLGNVREAAWRERQLAFLLAELAPTDADLEIARSWLGEQAGAEEERREAARRSWLKLLLTGLPLAFAVGLVALLVVVLVWG